PFEVALARANATLAHDRVEAANARREAERAQALVEQGLSAAAEADKAASAAAALVQTVKADEAAVATLQLQLDHCRIVSPISGRAGKIMVHAGNLVAANGEPLVVINQIKPIRIFFAVPQAEL